jgi:glycosyltransferase involved in cell wall biosynthesis
VKVLFVAPQPPAAQGGASDRCALGAIRALQLHGVEPLVVAAHLPFTAQYALPDLPHLEVIAQAAPSGWRGRIGSLRHPGGSLATGAFAERVRELASSSSEGIDVVHLDQTETAPAFTNASPPSVLAVQYRAALDRPYGLPWRRQFRHVLELQRAERRGVRNRQWLIANTTRIADTLRRLAPDADVRVIPLTLDTTDYVPAPPPRDAPPTAGMIGSAHWAPTAAAFDRLTHIVWPRVHALVPNAELALAGRGTAHEVADAAAFLRGLHVLLYPVERGSGMKVKTLEALALGVPVVTTPEGAEGMPSTDGIVIASSDAELATNAARILADPSERAQRSAAARASFDAHLAPAVVGGELVAVYEAMLTTR